MSHVSYGGKPNERDINQVDDMVKVRIAGLEDESINRRVGRPKGSKTMKVSKRPAKFIALRLNPEEAQLLQELKELMGTGNASDVFISALYVYCKHARQARIDELKQLLARLESELP